MKNSNSNIDKYISKSKIFQSLKVPERNKRLNILRNNVILLKNSVNLLNAPIIKSKVNKKIKKNLFTSQKRASLISRQYEARKIKKFKTLESLNTKICEINDDSLNLDNPEKEKNILYMDKASTLKRKNKILLEKMNNKNKNLYMNIFNKNKNEIFMTESNFPNIMPSNGQHNSLRKVHTESNNYYENTINNLKHNKIKDPIIRSSSDKKMLPPIRIINENFLNLDNYKNNKIINKERKNLSLSKDNSISLTENSLESINENDDIDKDKINKNKNINLTLDAERSNTQKRKKITKINKHLRNIFGSNSPEDANNSQMKKLVNKFRQIDINLKNRLFYYELEKWIMSSKFKYAQWRFGIADINKYFIDMKEYGQKEEKELEMRKSFYEKVNLVINELKEEKEKRELQNIENKYGIKIENEEKNVIKDNEYWNGDKASNKKEEMCKVLKLIKRRKIKEKKQRNLIEDIMFQCKKGINNIKNS